MVIIQMLKVDKFDDNLPEVINQINQLSYKTFSDLPRGKTNQKTNQRPSQISQGVKPIKAKALNDGVLCFGINWL